MKAGYRHLSLKSICRLFGKSRQSWYEQHEREDHQVMKNELILEKVRSIRTDFPKIGAIKLRSMIARELQGHQLSIGRDSFFRLLGEHGLLIKRRRKHARTTDSNHHFKKFPDLVNRQPSSMPESLWVSDITYIHTKGGFIYLSLITDAYSRKIVGYHLNRTLKADCCIQALKMALNGRIYPQRPLIHHSDRGIQYCCEGYVRILEDHQISISMTQSGSPYDNAIAERVNGILKSEFGFDGTFSRFKEVQQKVHDAIDKYNLLRPHFSCELQTPHYRHTFVKLKNRRVRLNRENKSGCKVKPGKKNRRVR